MLKQSSVFLNIEMSVNDHSLQSAKGLLPETSSPRWSERPGLFPVGSLGSVRTADPDTCPSLFLFSPAVVKAVNHIKFELHGFIMQALCWQTSGYLRHLGFFIRLGE